VRRLMSYKRNYLLIEIFD